MANILLAIALIPIFVLLGIIAYSSIIYSMQREYGDSKAIASRSAHVPPQPPPPKPKEMFELFADKHIPIGIDASAIDRVRMRDPLLFQYVVRRTFILAGLSIPSSHKEQYEAIAQSLPQQELAILIASLNQAAKYTCSYMGEELLQLWIDCSPSMKELMENGMTRFAWAKSVAVSLISQAFRAKTGVILRMFSDSPHDAYVALQATSYDGIVNALLSAHYGGQANVRLALEQALADRATKQKGFKRFHIVFITDSDERECADVGNIGGQLNSDTFCHALVIGDGIPAFERIARTYRAYQ